MNMRITNRLALALIAVGALATAAQAAIWGERDALNRIQDTSDQIQFLTAGEGLTGGQGLATDPLPESSEQQPVVVSSLNTAEPEIEVQNDQSFCDVDFGCANACDDDCDCCDRPCWTVWAGAIFLHRSHADVLAVANTGNPSAYYFNTPAGPDLNAIRRGGLFDLDFRYFNVFNMQAAQGLSLAANDFTFGAFNTPGRWPPRATRAACRASS